MFNHDMKNISHSENETNKQLSQHQIKKQKVYIKIILVIYIANSKKKKDIKAVVLFS